MENIVRTVYGAALQSALLMGLSIEQLTHTSLNEKLGIRASDTIPNGLNPVMKYFAIGNGGHSMTVGANNIPVMEFNQHLPTDAALFNQLPFVLRLPANDLTPIQAAKYRLRKNVTIGGTSYVAYYLKVIDLTATAIGLNYNAVSNGVTTTTPFVPSNSNLNPVPAVINSNGSVSTTGDYVSASGVIPIVLTADDVSELINVSNILYGNSHFAIVSEIAICSGFDTTVSGVFNGNTINYVESIYTQVVSFVNSSFFAEFNRQLNLSLDVGSVEPLLALS